jgi:hypothetical protein
VIRERIGRAVLRAYPPAVRQARGLKMLGMLLDAGEQSCRAFVRESGSLVLGGLGERRAIATRAKTRRLIADSCCQAVLIWLTLLMISAVSSEIIAGPRQQLLIQGVGLAAILALALVGFERIAAVTGLAAVAALGPVGPHTQLVTLARVLVPIACLLVMALAPRQRPPDPRRLVWLMPVAVLAALGPRGHVGLPEALAVMSIGGLLRLPSDPRFAIACSVVWITLLSTHTARAAPAGLGVVVILAAMAGGLILTVAAGRLWIVRHSSTR